MLLDVDADLRCGCTVLSTFCQKLGLSFAGFMTFMTAGLIPFHKLIVNTAVCYSLSVVATCPVFLYFPKRVDGSMLKHIKNNGVDKVVHWSRALREEHCNGR